MSGKEILSVNELKPCPFCGNKARYHRAELMIKGKWTDSIIVKCTKCNSRTRRYLFDGTTLNDLEKAYANATANWNARV